MSRIMTLMNKKKSKNNPVALLCRSLGTVLLIFLILICIPLVIPNLMGLQVYAVVSGSMEPAIPIGSLVYIQAQTPETVQAGSVIAFYGSDDGLGIVTHRVVENRIVSGEFITKGDANEKEDMNAVPYNRLIGEEVFCIPKAGNAAQLLSSLTGRGIAAGVIMAAVLLHIISITLERGSK
jgi:signal peptidase